MKSFLPPEQRSEDDERKHERLAEEAKELDLLLHTLISGQHPDKKDFLKYARKYNQEFACGTISTQKQHVPGAYVPIKINGQVGFNLSGLHRPANPDPATGEQRVHIGGQVWTLDPDEAINVRRNRNNDERLGLSVRKFKFKFRVIIP